MKNDMKTLGLIPGDMLYCPDKQRYVCNLGFVVYVNHDVLWVYWKDGYGTGSCSWILQDYSHPGDVHWLKDFARNGR